MSEDHERNVCFVLPQYVAPLGHSCAKEWCEKTPGYSCGCPLCLADIGCTLVFHVDDYAPEDGIQEHWRKRVVSIRTGRLAAPLICPGYPGFESPAIPEGKPTRSTGSIPRAGSQSTEP